MPVIPHGGGSQGTGGRVRMGSGRRRGAVGHAETGSQVRVFGGAGRYGPRQGPRQGSLRTRVTGRLVAGVLATAGLCLAAPAHADDTQVIQGGSFPTDRTFLTYVPCSSFFAGATPPVLRINSGPDGVPMGERSAGLVPQGAGSAAGPVVMLDSMRTGTATVDVHTAGGGQGVSWAWVVTSDAPRGHAWLGRADVSAPAGWSRVDARSLTYAWSLVDLGTRRTRSSGPSTTLAGLTSAHGDGPGYVVSGLGCDGAASQLDAVRGGAPGAVTTYDIEGLALTTTIDASRTRVPAGRRVTLLNRTVDAVGRSTGDLVVLQELRPDGTWRDVGETVTPEVDGLARAEVRPEQTTTYRWYRPEGEYAAEGYSAPLKVVVTR